MSRPRTGEAGFAARVYRTAAPTDRMARWLPLAVAAAALALAVACGEPQQQPIPFNHAIHTVENEIACEDCHQNVMSKASAGQPGVDLCIECHRKDITANPAAAPVIRVVRDHRKAGTELSWARIYELPDHVYYSHRRHAKIAKIECSECHGDLGKSTVLPDRPIAKTLTMDNCTGCHERRGVSNDCAWCHR